jgi:nucleoside-diphosphate-sugar epimerase
VNVLIVGGTGLISTSITRQLLREGFDVTLVNRGQTEARLPEGTRTIIADRKNYPVFEEQMQRLGSWDCVIDMVCFLPEEAESAVRAFCGRTKQFIFCSTVDVYSKPASRYPIVEDEPRKGNNAYGRNKILCEDIFIQAGQHGDFQTTIIRPAMTYGETRGIVDWTGWSSRIFDRIRKGKPIIVHGDGSAIWVACHVDDMAHAFARAVGNERAYGKAYHVTGEEWLTWNRYYQLVAEAMGVPAPELVHIPTDLLGKISPERAMVVVTNLQGNNIFDNSAARADLDFRYTIPWVEGVRRVVTWLDERGRMENSDDDPLDDRIIAAYRRLESRLVDDFGSNSVG